MHEYIREDEKLLYNNTVEAFLEKHPEESKRKTIELIGYAVVRLKRKAELEHQFGRIIDTKMWPDEDVVKKMIEEL